MTAATTTSLRGGRQVNVSLIPPEPPGYVKLSLTLTVPLSPGPRRLPSGGGRPLVPCSCSPRASCYGTVTAVPLCGTITCTPLPSRAATKRSALGSTIGKEP